MSEYVRTDRAYTTEEYMQVLGNVWSDADALAMTYLNWLTTEELSKQEKIREYRQWYYGELGAPLTNRQKEYLKLQTNDEVNMNFAKLVVDELARRLRIIGFESESNVSEDRLNLMWRRNGMASNSIKLHRLSVRDGDAYLVVDWDTKRGMPRFTVNPAFDGHSGLAVKYDADNREIEYAVKRWTVDRFEGTIRRMNIYHPDKIERFVSDPKIDGGKWKPYDGDGDPPVIPWTDGAGEPLGIPVFHFPYQPTDSPFGFSVLEPVIPLQIMINKILVDMVAAADLAGFRVYTMIGAHPLDSDGEPINVEPGGWISTTQPPSEVSIGAIDGSDLRPIIDVLQSLKLSIAQVTETPIHMFQIQGQSASEGSLRQQGVGLAGRIKEAADLYEHLWEAALLFALHLDYVFGPSSQVPPDAVVDVQWAEFDILGKEERILMLAEAMSFLTGAFVSTEAAYKVVTQGFNGTPLSEIDEREILDLYNGDDNGGFNEPDSTETTETTG